MGSEKGNWSTKCLVRPLSQSPPLHEDAFLLQRKKYFFFLPNALDVSLSLIQKFTCLLSTGRYCSKCIITSAGTTDYDNIRWALDLATATYIGCLRQARSLNCPYMEPLLIPYTDLRTCDPCVLGLINPYLRRAMTQMLGNFAPSLPNLMRSMPCLQGEMCKLC